MEVQKEGNKKAVTETPVTSEKIEQALLQELSQKGSISDSGEWALQHRWKHDDTLVGVLKRFEAALLINTKLLEKKLTVLTEEAEEILNVGSPEARVWNAISASGSLKSDVERNVGAEVFKIGFSQAMKNKWLSFDSKTQMLTRVAPSIKDTTQEQLLQVKSDLASVSEEQMKELKKRKLLNSVTLKTFQVEKGENFSSGFSKLLTDITTEMISDGSWKNKQFKQYNFNALGTATEGGHLHPLLKVREEFREIFLELGFEEMPTNNFVESSFWNFDALFTPQQHPARDAHDTFFLSEPAETRVMPEDYVDRVKEMHSKGGHGSFGWKYDWKLEEAKKNVLRTHTTAISTRMLYKLAQEGFQPKKYFSIDRVFRNEVLDATHLAEFHQIEGVVADYNLTLGNLMGIIQQFFQKLGIRDLRFKPAFNPYTEPSMEVFAYHPLLKKWVEIGNSGIFRPEMLIPMGLPPNMRVIAWGLGLERPTMIRYGIENIRDLVGHKVSIDFVKNNPIARMDK